MVDVAEFDLQEAAQCGFQVQRLLSLVGMWEKETNLAGKALGLESGPSASSLLVSLLLLQCLVESSLLLDEPSLPCLVGNLR